MRRGLAIVTASAMLYSANTTGADEPLWSAAEIARIATLAGPGEVSPDPTNYLARDPTAIRLGRDLFFDPRLSGNNAWSCATCHQPARGWGDGEPTPSRFPAVERNTPTLWDVGAGTRFFWDGRTSTLWRQAISPIESPDEMDGHRLKVALLIQQEVHLREAYEALAAPFDRGLDMALDRLARVGLAPHSHAEWEAVFVRLGPAVQATVDDIFQTVTMALAAFQAELRAGPSRFDRFVETLVQDAEPEVFSASEMRGLRLFIGLGDCISCHTGPFFSDEALHDTAPEGVPGTPAVKTPRLRNVALTAPYMHDGRVATLDQAVAHRGGQILSQRDRADLAAFLRTLTDRSLGARDPGGLAVVERYLRSKR